MITFLQINLQRSATAQSLAQQTSASIGAQVLLLSEQNWSPARDDRWTVSTDGTCAVVLTPTAEFVADTSGSGRGFAWIQTRNFRTYSCYSSRNDSSENYTAFLGDLEQSIRSADPNCTLVIGGDFNAWSHSWGSTRNDQRGDQLSDLAASLDLLVGNNGYVPTYVRSNAESIIDVTFLRPRSSLSLADWRVLDEVESASDHSYIQFRLQRAQERHDPPERLRGWSYRRLDTVALTAHLAAFPTPHTDVTTTADDAADQLVAYLSAACDSCMPPRAPPPAGRKQVHWWNETIAALRVEHSRSRRCYHRAARRREPVEQLQLLREAYKTKRKELRTSIRTAQAKSWSDLCAAVDSDPWGLPYRVVTKRIGRNRPGTESRGRESTIADHLFPNHPLTDWHHTPLPPEDPEHDEQVTGPFTMPELQLSCKRLPPGKATGPDGVPNEVLAKIAVLKPRVLLDAFNTCLQKTTFPTKWKQARLVLLHKGPGKPTTEPTSYRPLCMLDSAGKLLERLLLSRLDQHLDRTGRRSPNQYGFRSGRSTEDAIERLLETAHGAALGAVQHRDICVAVSLDVRNAFNSAPWPMIDAALRGKLVPPGLISMIRSYLKDRSILVGELLLRRDMTCGVPQGSVLGPALWNAFYDALLDLEMPQGVQLVAFADDVCVLGIARTGQAATTLMNPVLETVSIWMRENGLTLAPQKSEAVVLTHKHKYTDPELFVNGHAIPVKRSMRYLGVQLDSRLSFTEHIQKASQRATESALAIGRLMPNLGGPSQSKRSLIATVVNSKMLYASPTWASRGTKTAKNRAEMARAQRKIALRITRCYRTVSADASSLLSSMIPADLLANERARIRLRLNDQDDAAATPTIRKQEREISTRAWQSRWDRVTASGRWTHRLLPDVTRWLNKPPLNLTYHLSQALTGHGCFKSYLHKRDRAEDSYCVYCMDPDDTVEHTLFACPRWEDDRSRMAEILRRPLEPEDVEEILCGPRTDALPDDASARSRLLAQAHRNRLDLIAMIEAILGTKEDDEREDQRNG